MRSHKGVPQGGVLSPLFYILYVAKLLKSLPKTVQMLQFADDITLFSNNRNSLEKALNQAEKQLSYLGLELAPQKTVFINFNNLKIKPGKTKLKLNESFILTKNILIYFSRKLTKLDLIVMINRLRADHYNLAFSLARMNIIDDPTCEYKKSVQDIDHVIWQCSLYD